MNTQKKIRMRIESRKNIQGEWIISAGCFIGGKDYYVEVVAPGKARAILAASAAIKSLGFEIQKR